MCKYKLQTQSLIGLLILFPSVVLANSTIITNDVSVSANNQNGESSVSIQSYSNINDQEESYSYSTSTRGSIQKSVSTDIFSISAETIIGTEESTETLSELNSLATSSFSFVGTNASPTASTTDWWISWLNQLLKYVEKFI